MGLFDIFSGSPEKRVKSLQKKVTERYGPPENRQKAIEQLVELGTPEAISALLMRFTIAAEPSIADAEEKDYTYQAVVDFGNEAIEPIKAFLRRSDVAASWALKMLRQLLPVSEVVGFCIEILEKLGPEYTRDPEKKTVLVSTLGELSDPRIPPALSPFLQDPSDEVRIATAVALRPFKDEQTREPMLQAMVDSADRARVVAALATTLLETGLGVQGFREKIEKILPEGFYVDRSGVIKRRG